MNWKKEKQFIDSILMKEDFFINRLIEKKKDYENDIDYNLRCPICGDSKKSASKKRGHIFWKENDYNKERFDYYCFNCGASLSFPVFLSYLKHRGLIDLKTKYDRYNLEIIGLKDEELPIQKSTINHNDIEKIIEFNKIYKKFVKPIEDIPVVNEYVIKRKIPKIYWNTKLFAWDQTLQSFTNQHELLKSSGGMNQYIKTPFLVIPSESIINNELMVTGFNLRFLNDDHQPKYLKVDLDLKTNLMKFFTNQFDLEFDSQYIIIVEGEIDSLMFQKTPSIAIKSAHLTRAKKLEELSEKTLVYCWDNEYFSNTQIKKLIDKLNASDYSVIWNIDANNNYKDINNMIMSGYIDNIDEYIKDKIYSGLKRKLVLGKRF